MLCGAENIINQQLYCHDTILPSESVETVIGSVYGPAAVVTAVIAHVYVRLGRKLAKVI